VVVVRDICRPVSAVHVDYRLVERLATHRIGGQTPPHAAAGTSRGVSTARRSCRSARRSTGRAITARCVAEMVGGSTKPIQIAIGCLRRAGARVGGTTQSRGVVAAPDSADDSVMALTGSREPPQTSRCRARRAAVEVNQPLVPRADLDALNSPFLAGALATERSPPTAHGGENSAPASRLTLTEPRHLVVAGRCRTEVADVRALPWHQC
jgi:hypothetical protein